ncbi:MAG: ORF6N domain-containing protein [Collinsella aerofaciens]|nr:ORF6N domain-containing protein [Collinsella aerofaciens]
MSQRVRCCPRCQHGGLDAFLLAFRFPADFRFRLTREEYDALRFQIGTSKQAEGRGGRRYMPYAYTEQGVAMLSAVLRSDTAVQVSIQTLRVRIPPLAHKKSLPIGYAFERLVSLAGTEGFCVRLFGGRVPLRRFAPCVLRWKTLRVSSAPHPCGFEFLRLPTRKRSRFIRA